MRASVILEIIGFCVYEGGMREALREGRRDGRGEGDTEGGRGGGDVHSPRILHESECYS